MEIQIDSREKAKAIQKILTEFDRQGIKYFTSKLFCGDYQSLDNARLCIDRKQNLTELCGNLCQQHKRFKAELERAQSMGIQLIILCEHGGKITSLDAVKEWVNPRQRLWKKEIRVKWHIPESQDFEEAITALRSHGAKFYPPTSGEQLHKMLTTISEKYNVEFQFCQKSETGQRIIELLGGDA